jgi:hypothetical protein
MSDMVKIKTELDRTRNRQCNVIRVRVESVVRFCF